MLRAIALNVMYHKKLSLNMIYFTKHCYLYMSLPLAVSLVLGFALITRIYIQGWLGFFVKVAAVIIVYASVVTLFELTRRKLQRHVDI